MITLGASARPVEPGQPVGLLLSRDLFFTSKITGTAEALGHRVAVVGGAEAARQRLADAAPVVVFVDLAAGDLVEPSALAHYKSIRPAVPFVAFGSHVDTDALQAARAAGCEQVMPRSRFVNELPDLIRRHFAG